MISVVLLLGGNRGSVAETFAAVRSDLEREVGHIECSSELLRSASWGFEADDFLNQAVELSTNLLPEELLDATQAIEQRWGRARESEQQEKMASGQCYSSRTIDIDIIFYGDQLLSSERLTIPHALLSERRFALEPIAQIAPQRRDVRVGKSVEQMLNELKC